MPTALPINQIVEMYSPDAVIECACGGRKIIHGQEGIAAYWRHRFIEMPALELEDLQVDGGAVVISYRTSSGIVQAMLDIAEDGMINRCRCGPIRDDRDRAGERGGSMQDMLAQLEKLRRDAAECGLIRDLATDPKKRELFDRLAAHLTQLASEVEQTILEKGKKVG